MASLIASVQKVINRRAKFFLVVFLEYFHILFIGFVTLFTSTATVFAQPSDWLCGSLANSYGPYDCRFRHHELEGASTS